MNKEKQKISNADPGNALTVGKTHMTDKSVSADVSPDLAKRLEVLEAKIQALSIMNTASEVAILALSNILQYSDPRLHAGLRNTWEVLIKDSKTNWPDDMYRRDFYQRLLDATTPLEKDAPLPDWFEGIISGDLPEREG